jgi:hypothetical protein
MSGAPTDVTVLRQRETARDSPGGNRGREAPMRAFLQLDEPMTR